MSKSNLEKLATKVALNVHEIKIEDLDNPSNLKGLDIAAILAFIETIATVIKTITDMCPNKSTIVKVAKNPNFLQRIRFRSMVAQACDNSGHNHLRKVSGKMASETIAEVGRMTEDDLQLIVDEVTALDNFII